MRLEVARRIFPARWGIAQMNSRSWTEVTEIASPEEAIEWIGQLRLPHDDGDPDLLEREEQPLDSEERSRVMQQFTTHDI